MNRGEKELLASHGRGLATLFQEVEVLRQHVDRLEKRLLVLEAQLVGKE